MPAKRESSTVEIFQIKVTLQYSEPAIWRRLLVPSDMPLDRLHNVLQCAMGWEDDHLHEFRAGKQAYGPPRRGGGVFDMDDVMDEGKVRLHEVLARVGSKFTYTYDFGDGWEHIIVLEKRLPADTSLSYPACTGGERAGPPEDCGGIHGYYQLVEAIADPDHERHEERLEWVGEEWDPEAFSIEAVNRKLAPKKRRPK